MGAVSRRLSVLAALLALAVPAAGHGAESFGPPFGEGPRGGDQFNFISANAQTGDMTVVRASPVPTNGGLGCGGAGGFANFTYTYTAATPLQSVTVAWKDALVDPYTWINVGVRQGSDYTGDNDYLYSEEVRGIIAGTGVVTVDVAQHAATGPITVWFGLQVSSACPSVDGGRITFTSVAFDVA